jgi:hypothetical protein
MADQDVQELLVKIGVDVADMKRGMREAKDQVDNFAKTLKGLQVGAAALAAGSKAVDFLKNSAAAAAEAEAVTNKLTQALRLQGVTSESTRDEILDYSKALQQQSIYGDEAITSAQTTLIQLGRLSGEGLRTATQATLDLAAGLGIDLNTAALLVGKAAAGSTSAFSRYGLVVKSTGDKSKDFASILDQISAKFGGQAKTATESYAGSVSQLRENFGDLQEEIGKRLTPVLGTAAKKWSEWIQAFNNWSAADAPESGKSFDLAAEHAEKLGTALKHLQEDAISVNGITLLTAAEADLIEQETGLKVAIGDGNKDLAIRIALINEAITRNERWSRSNKLAKAEEEALKPTAPTTVDPAAEEAARKASQARVAQAEFEADQLMKIWAEEADARERLDNAARDIDFDKLFRLPAAGADELTLSLNYAEQALADLRALMEAEGENGVVTPEELSAIDRYKQTIIELRAEIEKKNAAEKKGAEDKRKQDEATAESLRQQQELYQALGNTVTSVFQDVALDGEDMGEAVKNALRGIAMDLVRIAIARIIANAGVTGSNVAARDSTTMGVAAIPVAMAAFAAVAAMAGRIPSFHEGGKIGGPPGRDPSIIRVERGERILSREQNAAFEAGAMGGGSSFTFNFNSVLPPDPAEMRRAVRDHILPAFADLQRGRMM